MKKPLRIVAALLAAFLVFSACVPFYAEVEPRAGVVTAYALTVRSGPSTGYKALGYLTRGSYVRITGVQGGWYSIEYGEGASGFCSSYYIKTVAAEIYYVNVSADDGGYLNVRTGPSTSYSKITSLASGCEVTELSRSGGWSEILYGGGETGYVSNYYLLSAKAALAPEAADKYAAVLLEVPSFKQYDSRWSGVYVKNSGYTIRQIGCAITCLAMTESFYSGYTYTPASVVRDFSFTPGGAVYWSSDYGIKYTKTDYLEFIYEKLLSGTPVIIGGYTSYGGSHFVVVCGYKGGDVFTESDFIIRDPASGVNETLDSFTDKYTVFNKLVYHR